MKRQLFIASWIVLATVLPLAEPLSADPPRYHLQDLGDLGGGDTSANGINASGQVVGYSTNAAGHMRAFLKSRACPWRTWALWGEPQARRRRSALRERWLAGHIMHLGSSGHS